jgi:valyl-tRNA synthetase
MAKDRLRQEGSQRAVVQRVLAGVLDGILRLVQPLMPFVAESIWHALNEAAPDRGLPAPQKAPVSVVIAPWPKYPAGWQDTGVETRFARMQDLVRFVREVRNTYMIDAKVALDVFVRCPAATAADFRSLGAFITLLAGVRNLDTGPDVTKPAQVASHVTQDFEAYVSLEGLIDVAAEIKRLEKQLAEKRKFLQSIQAKLENANFVAKAPAEVVQQQRDQVVELEKQIATIMANLQELAK